MNIIENTTNIDILFIDNEGSEFQILESIDFRHIKIKIICVENFYNDYKIYHLLKNNNYKMIARTTHDEIYSNIHN